MFNSTPLVYYRVMTVESATNNETIVNTQAVGALPIAMATGAIFVASPAHVLSTPVSEVF
jgi:hypothetical protein